MMNDIQLKLNETGKGAFVIEENGDQLAEMAVSVANGILIAYHTEVSDKLAGQGVGKKLLNEMVDYSRANNLKVVPLCPFVKAQFERSPEKFEDIWKH